MGTAKALHSGSSAWSTTAVVRPDILAHASEHPTVYLPSHDPESAARLAARTTVNVDPATESRDSAATLLPI